MNKADGLSVTDIIRTIDHAILLPTVTTAQLQEAIDSVRHLPLASVCVNSVNVRNACSMLAGTAIPTCAVVGFPAGSVIVDAKLKEAEAALNHGASEIDMVIHQGAALSGDLQLVALEVSKLALLVHTANGKLKVILESGVLNSDSLLIQLCRVCSDEGADFVKTSTGFGYIRNEQGQFTASSATVHDVELMARSVSGGTSVKASGGIRSVSTARAMLNAGATRLGTSSTLSILADQGALGSDY